MNIRINNKLISCNNVLSKDVIRYDLFFKPNEKQIDEYLEYSKFVTNIEQALDVFRIH